MKGIAKKNQIIITSLAILIAVAGYLNYSEKNLKDLKERSKETADSLLFETGDIESNDQDIEDTQVNQVVADRQEEGQEEDGREESGQEERKAQENETSDDEVPGTAVFTNIGTFSANARLSREQLRAKNKETLLNMINSGNLTDQQKSKVTEEMLAITKTAELENEVEILLEAKGFPGAVVSVTDEQVEVVINQEEISDTDRAKIEDVVKRKTGKPVANIVITPISVEN